MITKMQPEVQKTRRFEEPSNPPSTQKGYKHEAPVSKRKLWLLCCSSKEFMLS